MPVRCQRPRVAMDIVHFTKRYPNRYISFGSLVNSIILHNIVHLYFIIRAPFYCKAIRDQSERYAGVFDVLYICICVLTLLPGKINVSTLLCWCGCFYTRILTFSGSVRYRRIVHSHAFCCTV